VCNLLNYMYYVDYIYVIPFKVISIDSYSLFCTSLPGLETSPVVILQEYFK